MSIVEIVNGGHQASNYNGAGTGLFNVPRTGIVSSLPNAVIVNNGAGVLTETLLLDPARGGTGVDTSTYTGVAKVSAGVWTAAPLTNADISGIANIDRTKIAAGLPNQVVINGPTGLLTSEPALSVSRGGTGQNFSAVGPGPFIITNSSGVFASALTYGTTNIPNSIVQRDAFGNNSANAINGIIINPVPAPTLGSVLTYDGSQWVAVNIDPAYTVFVQKNAAPNRFTSVNAAVLSIPTVGPNAPSSTNKYVVYVNAGTYSEPHTDVPSYVFIVGRSMDPVTIQPAGPGYSLFKFSPMSGLSFVAVANGDPSFPVLDCNNCGNYVIMHKVTVGASCPMFLSAVTDNFATDDSTIYLEYVDTTDSTTYSLLCQDTNPMSGFGTIVNIENFFTFGHNDDSIIVDGVNTNLLSHASEMNGTGGNCIRVKNGASIDIRGMAITGYNTGILVDNDLNTPNVILSGITFTDNVTNISILNSLTTGQFFGYSEYLKTDIPKLAPFFIANQDQRIITVAFKGANFTTVTDALNAALVDVSSTNRYIIAVGPGVFVEPGTISIPQYITIQGASLATTIIQPSGNFDMFHLVNGCGLNNLSIAGVNPTKWAVTLTDAEDTVIDSVRFVNCNQSILVTTPTSDDVHVYIENSYIEGIIAKGIYVTDGGSAPGTRMRCFCNKVTFQGHADKYVTIDGPYAVLTMMDCISFSDNTGDFCTIINGGDGNFIGSRIRGWGDGFTVPDAILNGPSLTIDGCIIDDNTGKDIVIANMSTVGHFEGYLPYLNTTIPAFAPFFIANRDQHIITVAYKGANFTSVTAALAAITDNSITSRYTIYVGPGVFVEPQIVMKPYVAIKGFFQTQSILLSHPSVAGLPFIKLAPTSAIDTLTISVASYLAPPSYLVEYLGDPSGVHARADNIIFDTSGGIVNVGSTDGPTIFLLLNPLINMSAPFTTGITIDDSGPNNYPISYIVDNLIWSADAVGMTNFVYLLSIKSAKSPSPQPNVFGAITNSTIGQNAVAPKGIGCIVEGSVFATVETTIFGGFVTGLSVLSSAEVTNLVCTGSTFSSNTTDIDIASAIAMGTINANATRSKVVVISTNTTVGILINDHSGSISIGGQIYQGDRWSRVTQVSHQIQYAAVTGVINQMVQITSAGGLNIDVPAGMGYVMTGIEPDDYLKYITWNASPSFPLPDNSLSWVYIDNTGAIASSLSEPNLTRVIILGTVKTYGGAITYIQEIGHEINNLANGVSDMLRDVVGPVSRTGTIASPGSSLVERAVQVSGGEYRLAEKIYLPGGNDNVSMIGYYGGTNETAPFTNIPLDYDNAGVLTPIPAGRWAKHSFHILSSLSGVAQYFFVYAQVTYASELLAQEAQIPTPPGTFGSNMMEVAGIIVTDSDPSSPLPAIRFRDIRPGLSFRSEGFSAQADHGDLLGLATGDDHPQYFRNDGTHIMSGSLNLGTQNIIGAGGNLLMGVDITAHAARHLPGGPDALTTAAPVSIGSTNAIGAAAAFARSDHIHAGVNNVNANGGTARQGTVTLVNGTGTTVVDTAGSFAYNLNIPVLISSGGTNSTTALTNGKIMVSVGGQIVEGTSSSTPVFSTTTLTSASNQLTLGSGNTVIINAPAPAVSRIYTVPDVGANANFVMTEGNQTINGNKTLTGVTNLQSLGYYASSGSSTYAVGTAAQSGNTVTGTVTAFSPAMVGGIIVYSTGATATITGYTSTSVITAQPSQTVSPTTPYTIYYGSAQESNGYAGFTGINVSSLSPNAITTTDASRNLTSQTLTNGQILIGSTGNAPVIAFITGTANQITSTAGPGSITLSTPTTFIAPGSIASVTSITAGTSLASTTSASIGTSLTVGTLYSDGTTANITATGATQGTATALTTSYNVATTVAPSTGVLLPVSVPGTTVTIVNRGANNLNVYPQSGSAIDGLATDIPVIIPVGGAATYEAASSLQWYTITSPAVIVSSFSAGTTGLTPSTPTVGSVTLGGTLIALNGGTGFSSYAVGDLLYADTTTTLAKLADIATGNVLLTGGVGIAPSYGKVNLTTHIAGILPIANGGTNSSTALTNGKIMVSVGGQIVEGTSSSTPVFSTTTLTSASNQLTLGSGNTVIINAPAPAVSRIYTVPDVGANANFVMTEGTQSIAGTKTFTGTTNLQSLGYYASSTSTTYAVGTASQSTNTITGVGTTFTPSMIGGIIVYSTGATATITGFTSATVLTAQPSQTVPSSTYTIYYGSGQIANGYAGYTGINVSSLSPSAIVTTDASRNLTSQTLTNGQILIGSTGNVPVSASITGTANQVTSTAGPGTITLSVPTTFIAPGSIASVTSITAGTSLASTTSASIGTSLTVGTLYSDGTTANITATGATQGTAFPLVTSYNVVSTVAPSTGVLLPVSVPGTTVTIVNRGANNLNVYPQSGSAIDGNAVNSPVVLPPGAAAVYEASSSLQWYTITSPAVTVSSFSAGTTGLTPSTPTVGPITMAGVLVAVNGGTGFSSYTIGDLLYADTTSTLAKLADVSVGRYLRSGGVSTAPLWSTLILPNAATTGDIMFASSTNTITSLADIAVGNVLLSGGVGTAPSYGKVNLTTHIAGVLPIANGGTNASTALTNGKIMVSVAGQIVEGTSSSTPIFSTTTLTATSNQLTLGSGNTITVTAPTPAANRVYTVPDVLANANFVMTEGNQTINGNKTLTGVTNLPQLGYYASSTSTTYLTGTASQSLGVITGVGTVFTPSMVGGIIVYSTGATATITGYTSAGVIAAQPSQTVPSSAYTIYYGAAQESNGYAGFTGINVSSMSPNAIVTTDANDNLITQTLTNGQILIGSTGNAPTVGTITGTANQVTSTAGPGSITLSTPTTFIAPGSIASVTTITAGTSLTSGSFTTVGTIYAEGTTNGITAAGATQATATVLTTSNNIVTTVAAATGVALPTSPTPGTRITIVNRGANGLNVYPALAAAIDGNAANTPVVLPAGTVGVYQSSSTLQWYSVASPQTSVSSFSAGTTGLTPSTPTVGPITLSGTLIAVNGGTGFSSYAVGDLLYADTTSTLAKLADVTAGRYLRSGGVSTAPLWSTLVLPNAATTGDILFASSANTITSLADIAVGNVLLSGGVGVIPSYGKVNLTTHITGVLPIANGGTNASTALTNGKIMVSVAGQIVEGTSSSTPTFVSETLTQTTNQLTLGTTNTVTINAVAPSASRTYSIQDAGANANFVMTESVQTINGNKTFTGVTAVTNATASTSFASGALVVTGGVGVAGSTNVQGNITAGTPAATTAKIQALQGTLGGEVMRLESAATNDDPVEVTYQNRVATTTNAVTTLHTFTIPASTTYHITATVVARRTGGTAGTAEDSASFVINAVYKNVGGNATLIGAVNRIVSRDQASWNSTLTPVAGTVRLTVAGANNNNVTWHVTAKTYYVST